jgi:hypothetical protein
MRVFLFILLLVMGTACLAQEEPLVSLDVEIVNQLDAFGLEQMLLVGEIRNDSDDAYSNISVVADLLDEDGEVIGEAFGYVVDECGEAILDFPLQPDQERPFLASVELFEDGEIDSIDVSAEGTVTEAEPDPELAMSEAVKEVAQGEVVLVEWEDAQSLRYGVGCDGSLFTRYDWYRYNLENEVISPLEESPNAQYITDAFIHQTGINLLTQGSAEDATLIERSFLTFPTQTPRIVYQNDIHSILTSEVDGSFKRIVHTTLSQFSLQGFVWAPTGNFAAYYFGAYGEPVRYFTASPTGGRISAALQDNTPSQTVPGLSDDGQRVVISGTFPNDSGEDITGYWFSSTINQQRELLFEVDELAGNNYPAPVYYRRDDVSRFIYIIRPIEGVATLQCYYREEEELFTLTTLPLQLDTDERAWAWMSPDNQTLAIGANGNHAGLWLVDLEAFEECR